MEQIGAQIIQWYRHNRRILPWRENREPYRIWISEIILQQTRVDQGMPYFLKFIAAFPDVKTLARAPIQHVLKSWEGLGYYARARNLHFTAKQIVKEGGSEFPRTYDELLKLKGIGPYTAAAISSICYEEPRAVVDGNVYRVLARFFGIKTPSDSTQGKKQFQELAQQLLGTNTPSEFNQAIMEFGAMYCKPSAPDCPNCVLFASCYAGASKKTDQFPVGKTKTKIRTRYLFYFLLEYKGKILVQERKQKDIWKGLFEFPFIETKRIVKPEKALHLFRAAFSIPDNSYTITSPPVQKKHLLSHQELRAYCYKLRLKKKNRSLMEGKWIHRKNIGSYPFPRLLVHFMDLLD